MEKYNINDLKNTVNDFENARRGLSQGTDIFNNMAKLSRSINTMDPILKSQAVYIKKFFHGDQPKSESEKAGQFKREFNRLCDIAKAEFYEIMEAADNFFAPNRRERKETWVKICKDYENNLNRLREKADINNFFELLFSILNTRDFVIKQLMKSLMYRKEMLWMDLGIATKQYVHTESKKLMERIQTKQEELGYAPTLIEFTAPTFEEEGTWKLMQSPPSGAEPSLPALLSVLNSQYNQMVEVVKNYAKLNESPESFEDINKNTKIIKGFREKIQVLNDNYSLLLQRYRQANIKNEDKEDMSSLREKLEQYETILFQRDNEISEMKQQFNGSSSIIQALKEKVKQQEAELARINNYEVTKLRELELVQNTLSDEFAKIKKEVGNYAVIYKLQNESKKEILKQIDVKQTQIERLITMLNREKNKIATLNKEIIRLNQVILELGGNLPE